MAALADSLLRLRTNWRRVATTIGVGAAALATAAAAVGGLSIAASQRAAAAAHAPIPVALPASEAPVVVEQPTNAPSPGNDTPSDVALTLPIDRIDQRWAARTAAATGIPERAFLAYAAASLQLESEQPSCGISWNTLAGIGLIESAHGSHGGAQLLASGFTDRPILGPVLNGHRTGLIRDSDHGKLDGDTGYDRAVGPMQFIPRTWERWGADANGDGMASPNQIDDAALTAARYLCADGSVGTPAGWRAAILSYNHSQAYVDRIAAAANQYAAKAA